MIHQGQSNISDDENVEFQHSDINTLQESQEIILKQLEDLISKIEIAIENGAKYYGETDPNVFPTLRLTPDITEIALEKGEYYPIKATSNVAVTIEESDPSVVTYDLANHRVYAAGEGEATITFIATNTADISVQKKVKVISKK